MNWYLDVLKKYAVFEGRARRKEYWMFTLFQFIAIIILSMIDGVLGTMNQSAGFGLLSGLYMLGTFIPSLAVFIRRLHDIGKSGWWFFIGLIPLIGGIILLVFMCLDSQPGNNAYGASPK